jgi:WD40 repeat protein
MLKIWDANRGTELATFAGTEELVACAYSTDGRRIVSAYMDNTLQIRDAESGAALRTLTGHFGQSAGRFNIDWGAVRACTYSPDARRILSACADSTLKIWDAESGAELIVLASHERKVRACAYSPDGERIVSASEDRTLKIWDAGSGEQLLTLAGHLSNVTSCAYSPDGRRIVSGSDDKSLKIWDAESGAELATLVGHSDEVAACAYSPDGRRIVSIARKDPTVRIWDAATGSELRRLTAHSPLAPGRSGRAVPACGWLPNGRHIVSVGDDGTCRIWDIHTASLALCFVASGGLGALAISGGGYRLATGDHWGLVYFLRLIGLPVEPPLADTAD